MGHQHTNHAWWFARCEVGVIWRIASCYILNKIIYMVLLYLTITGINDPGPVYGRCQTEAGCLPVDID